MTLVNIKGIIVQNNVKSLFVIFYAIVCEILVASAKFLVTLATSKAQFRALNNNNNCNNNNYKIKFRNTVNNKD